MHRNPNELTMKIKSVFFLIVCFAVAVSFAQAQSTTPTVIATQGDYFTSSSGKISWTLGEIVTETLSTSGNKLTQGFQQPDLRIDNYIHEIDGNVLSVYPNPTFDEVIIDLSKMTAGNYSFSVFNMAGQLMNQGAFTGGTGESINHLSFRNYAGGNYLLVVSNTNNKYQNSIKIFKAN